MKEWLREYYKNISLEATDVLRKVLDENSDVMSNLWLWYGSNFKKFCKELHIVAKKKVLQPVFHAKLSERCSATEWFKAAANSQIKLPLNLSSQ